jgi:predicted DNA-binding transcriptional regulator AlpA
MSASRNFGPEDNRVLTFKEVAARYRVCRRTLERGIATERFPRPMRIGSALRFSEVDLIAFEQKSKEPPQKAASPPQK